STTSWQGGEKLGTGNAVVVESIPNERVAVRLEYFEPFQMVQNAEYIVRVDGEDVTFVTWRVTGENSFIGKFMSLFVDMDKIVGDLFDQGLRNLKTLVEET